MTIAQAIIRGSKSLHGRSSSPRLDTEVLVAFILGQNRTHLTIHPEHPLMVKQQQRLRRLITRRRNGVPVPYLTGTCEFFGMRLKCTPAVLVPRPFTELLVEAIIKQTRPQHHDTIADIGTGSGAIALALAQYTTAKIIASDISLPALAVAKRNAKQLHLSSRITFVRGSLLEPLKKAWPTLIVANLPYLTSRQLNEPSIAGEPRVALHGGTDGLQLIRQLLSQAKNFPSIHTVALEFDPPQLPTIRRLLKQWSPSVTVTTISDGRRIRGLIASE